MTLPVLTAPKHKTTLPVSKKEVDFRPFLVKEEKIMIIADSNNSEDDMIQAIIQVVDNCTFNKVNPETLCQADMEYLLLQIRGRSKGFESELVFRCVNQVSVRDEDGVKHPTDKKDCGHKNDIVADLKTVSLVGGNDSDLIDLGGGLGLKMATPSISVLRAIDKIDEDEIEAGFSQIMACIESIYNADEVWQAKDLSRNELSDFLDTFTSAQLDTVKEWRDNIPVLKLNIDYQCQSCGAKDNIVIEGIDNFFGY